MIDTRSTLMIVLAGIALASCSPATQGPPEIIVDQSACAHCSMLISEPRFAAAYRVGGTDKAFDDIGCLLDALADEPGGTPVQLWFRDLTDGSWISPEEATFVRAPDLRTPMAGGIVATAHPDEVTRLSERPDAVVYRSFDALRAAETALARETREETSR